MQLLRFTAYTFITFITFFCFTKADWFDDLVNGLHGKIVSGADYIKDKAAPTVRETFNEAKATLKDPETHRKIQTWVKEEAIPAIKAKVDSLVSFMRNEVVPELRDIKNAYDAASESN
uniref:Secreted protein n=1 Tax=Elaeophora elaphi TaxID=1147741 RepID=A0A0R3RRW8_9BILA